MDKVLDFLALLAKLNIANEFFACYFVPNPSRDIQSYINDIAAYLFRVTNR